MDGGTWQSGPLTLTDGQHTIDTRITDNAGNYTSSTNAVKVDTTPPQSAFTSPPEGSTTVIHGSFAMNGHTLDPTSGPASAEISLDGGTTWQPLLINGGNWTFTWNTESVPNGMYTIQVRARDVAGNEEHTASIKVIVVNAGPSVSITESMVVVGDCGDQYPEEHPASSGGKYFYLGLLMATTVPIRLAVVIYRHLSNGMGCGTMVPTGRGRRLAITPSP